MLFRSGQGTQRVDLGAGEIHVARPARRTRQLGDRAVWSGLALALVGIEERTGNDETLRAALLAESCDLPFDRGLCRLQCTGVIFASLQERDDVVREPLEGGPLILDELHQFQFPIVVRGALGATLGDLVL